MRVPVELPHNDRLRFALREYGAEQLAERAARLLATGVETDEFLRFLGGEAAEGVIDGHWPRYWAQSWGARALEQCWTPSAAPAVVDGLEHQAWRVRLGCARLCAIHELPESEKLAALTRDANWRVRDAAAWALGRVGGAEHAATLAALLADPEEKVAARADGALDELSARLGRPRELLIAEALEPEQEQDPELEPEPNPNPDRNPEPDPEPEPER